ncbi:MAG: SOS response-associated peptidase [Anaerolineaceae bacterium]
MCGRFTITLEPIELQEELELGDFPDDFIPRYNVAPTQNVAVTRDYTNRNVEWMRWGLVPFWAKDPSIGVRMINARSETLLEKPSFRDAFIKRRCLILADGFYEWQKFPWKQSSIPHYFYLKGKEPFFFAGLWDQWHSPSGDTLISCTIITGDPNELIRPIHDRMPVILNTKNSKDWLNPNASTDSLQALLSPYPAEQMEEHPVSTLVNSPGVDNSAIINKV